MIMQRKFILFLALFFAGLTTCLAQSSAFNGTYQATTSTTAASESSLLDMDDNNWSLYADEENKLYYVDFESLSMNLSDIVVRRKDGEVVLQDDVFELPVNTIYEIDFNQYGDGTYEIELRSFTTSLKRSVTVK